HGARDRAQPRRHQDGRLGGGPGARGRGPRRPDRGRGHARGRRARGRELHRPVPEAHPGAALAQEGGGSLTMELDPRHLLVDSFKVAVAAADPLQIVPKHLPPPPKGRTVVVGAGKAAGAMAQAVDRHWPAGAPLEGVVITRYGHAAPSRRIRVVEAGHPVPDEHGEEAAREILALAQSLGPDDLLLALVSGGGSSLLALPVEGVSMADLKALTRDLLASGAPIQDMNTVRKHLSRIQGGRLAAATRAQVLALVISDVTGDDPTHIASGPCAPAPTTFADTLEILERFGVQAPASIASYLER